MSNQDHYEILGLDLDATKEQISRAYKQQALLHHPDKNINKPEAQAKFHAISKAYEVLNDEKKRMEFDVKVVSVREKRKRDEDLSGIRKVMKQNLLKKEELAKLERQQAQIYKEQNDQKLKEQRNQTSQTKEAKEKAEKNSTLKNIDDIDRTVLVNFTGCWDKITLSLIFSKYGNIQLIEVNESSAKITFTEYSSFLMCLKSTRDIPAALTIAPAHQTSAEKVTRADKENIVLTRLRQAQERKRIIEEIKKSELQSENDKE